MRKSKNEYNPAAKYQSIEHACRTTGLSQYYLRNGCKSGAVPCIKCGRVYMIDVPGLYKALEQQREAAHETP